MFIISTLVLVPLAIILLITSDVKQRRKGARYMQYLRDDGNFRKTNEELEKTYRKALFTQWVRSVEEKDKSLFFPDKYDFFQHFPEAATCWVVSEAEERVIRDGYAPLRLDKTFLLSTHSNHSWYRQWGWAKKEEEYYCNRSVSSQK